MGTSLYIAAIPADGRTLQGQQYLEVPVQNQPIPQAVLDEATRQRVIIRDVARRPYNTLPLPPQ